MKVVTFITDADNPRYVNLLAASCRHHGLELTPLLCQQRIKPSRWDRAWNWLFPRERGFQHKDALLRDYLATVPDKELVLATDGYDAFFVAGETEIRGKFEKFQRPVVFSAEMNCHPDRDMVDCFPPVSGRMRYLNSGGFLGRAAELREAIDLVRRIPCPSRFSWSNQYRWSRLFLERPDLISLDYQSTIFFCAAVKRRGETWDPEHWERNLIVNDRVQLDNGSMPCHIHFNGPISGQIDQLTSALMPLTPWMGKPSGTAG